MKRRLSLFLSALSLALLFSACGGESTESPSPSPTETVSPEFETGILSDTAYENSFLGLRYTLPEGWQFATEDEKDELAGSGNALVESELNVKAHAEDSTYYEFYAYDAEEGVSSLVLVVEDLTAHENGKLITVKMFVDSLIDQYNNITSVQYVIGDSYRKTIGSRESIVLPIAVPEVALYQRNYVFRTGNYMASFTSTAQSEEELDAIEENITAITQ
ncbi:MAG: hypothetical protein AB7D36_00910 [Oscillospiraceae bacterium]